MLFLRKTFCTQKMNGFSWNYYAKRDNKKNMKQMKYLEICSVQLAFGMLLDMDRLY